MLESMRRLIIIKERNRNYILRLVFMNIFDPNINHEILFVMNNGELMQATTFCKTYKDSDTINDDICALPRNIFMTCVNKHTSV